MDHDGVKQQSTPYFWPYDFDELLRETVAMERIRKAVGAVNPRPPGRRNDLIQLVKKLHSRVLTWYTRPLREFSTSVTRSLEQIVTAVDHLSMNMVALESRLAQSEKRNPALVELIEEMQEHLALLHQQVHIDPGLCTDRTAYIIGLFGSGRQYINDLMRHGIGERAKYFRDTIRLHPGPTPMIYSGHVTMKYVSRFQELPAVMNRVLEAVRWGFADVIFIYRHPLDSLLTNWISWRTYLRDNRWIAGIWQVYQTTEDLCADLERDFLEFKAFAEGSPDFWRPAPGLPFLSFPQFVEETELHLQSATLAVRLEDFAIDPRKEFSKIVEVMSVDLDLSRLCVDAPKSKPYGYLAVKEKVPRFRSFIDGLDAETKRRIEKIGYDVTA